MNTRIQLFALTIAAILMLAVSVSAGQSTPRSVAMGGAYIGLAKGVDAARFNPANLGLNDYHSTSVELVGVGASITNNSFTLEDYNKYTGAFLTGDDKEYILSRIPSEGLKLSVDVEAAALSVSSGPFAFTITGVATADINLSRDLFELALNVNTFADTISITGSYSEAVSYASAGISYGRPIYSAGTRQLSVGTTVKYLYGIATEEVIELEGLASTALTGFQGEGKMVIRTATGGSGYAVDLGAALKLNDSYTIGAGIRNFLSHLTWNKNTEEHGYIFEFDTMTVDNMGDDYVVSDDYTLELESFSTTLPAVITVGIAKHSGSVRWAVDWEQGFRLAAGTSTKPRLAAGIELAPVGMFPLRAGFAFGGGKNTAFSVGSGLHFPLFHIDYAIVTGSSLSGYSSKGLNLALSAGLQF